MDNEDDRTGRNALYRVLSGMDLVVSSCCAFVPFGAGEAENVCANDWGRSITVPGGCAAALTNTTFSAVNTDPDNIPAAEMDKVGVSLPPSN